MDKPFSLVLCLILLCGVIDVNGGHTGCKFNIGPNSWDFGGLVRSQSQDSYYVQYTTGGQGNSWVYFNICEHVSPDNSCSSDSAFATEVRIDGSCYRLTGGDISDATYEYYTESNHTRGVSIHYSRGDVCPYSSNNEYFNLKVNVVCDGDRTGEPQLQMVSNTLFDPCNPIIQVNHADGCATRDVNAAWDFLSDIYFIVGSVVFLLGLTIAFFGLNQYKPVLMIIGALSTFAISLTLVYGLLLKNQSSLFAGILLCALILPAAIFVGHRCAVYSLLGVGLTGFWCGYISSLVLFFYTTYPVYSPTIGYALLWIVPITAGLVTAYFNITMFPKLHIISTSVIGAYLTIRGITAFTTEYTNEFLILNDVKEDRYDYVSAVSYLCLLSVIVLSLIAIVTQYLINDVKNFTRIYRRRLLRYSFKGQPYNEEEPSEYYLESEEEEDEIDPDDESLKLETKGNINYNSMSLHKH